MPVNISFMFLCFDIRPIVPFHSLSSKWFIFHKMSVPEFSLHFQQPVQSIVTCGEEEYRLGRSSSAASQSLLTSHSSEICLHIPESCVLLSRMSPCLITMKNNGTVVTQLLESFGLLLEHNSLPQRKKFHRRVHKNLYLTST
jgi:hypothetical protein